MLNIPVWFWFCFLALERGWWWFYWCFPVMASPGHVISQGACCLPSPVPWRGGDCDKETGWTLRKEVPRPPAKCLPGLTPVLISAWHRHPARGRRRPALSWDPMSHQRMCRGCQLTAPCAVTLGTSSAWSKDSRGPEGHEAPPTGLHLPVSGAPGPLLASASLAESRGACARDVSCKGQGFTGRKCPTYRRYQLKSQQDKSSSPG